MRLASPAHLVDINRVAGLDTVEVTPASVRVGALVRHAGLERSESAYAVLPLLRQALVNVAHPAIRNRGTTVGSHRARRRGRRDARGPRADRRGRRGRGTGRVARDRRRPTSSSVPLESSLAPEELAVAVRFGRFAGRHRQRPSPRRPAATATTRWPVSASRSRSSTASSRSPARRSSRSPTSRPSSTSRRRSEVSSRARPRGTPPWTGRRGGARARRARGRHPRQRRLPPHAGRGADPPGRSPRPPTAQERSHDVTRASETLHDVTRHGQRGAPLGRRARTAAALRLPAPRPRAHRHPRRLRARRVRRLHRARRRRSRCAPACMFAVTARRPRDHHRRGRSADARTAS